MLELLISTNKENLYDVIDNFKNYKNCKKTIIWQQEKNKDISISINDPTIRLFLFHEMGLAKSRNRAIELASEEICLFCDDDTLYTPGFEEHIQKAFEENPGADIITFQIKTPEGNLFKDYPKDKMFHNLRTIMKVSSIEIAFKRTSILKAGLKFDERFGLKSNFPTGEENIFLADAIKKGLKILYIPVPIAIHPVETSGRTFDETLVKAKGAMFYRIFKEKAYLVSFLFAIKKYKNSPFSLLEFYNLMLKGINEFKSLR